jgi:hypothetical protein
MWAAKRFSFEMKKEGFGTCKAAKAKAAAVL